MKTIAFRLKPKGALPVCKGHPWVFRDSVERTSAGPEPGDTAVLYDVRGKTWIGAGICDPQSNVCVKVLAFRKSDPVVGEELFERKIAESMNLRRPLIPAGTNAFRVINGESDGFPGMAADFYGGPLVIKFYSAAWFPHIGEVKDAFRKVMPEVTGFVIRFSREIADSAPDCGNPSEASVVFSENGLRFRADLLRGQKTGFFLDQRDNRARTGKISAGKTVLNVFSYSGGFSLYAARGGAGCVTSIDADGHALELLAENFALNSRIPAVAACPHEELRGDAFDLMRGLAAKGRRFGIVVVDPPSFAKSAAETQTALHTYSRLAALAVKLAEPGGTLVFASCSSRVGADELFETVKRAASASGRPLREIERTAHAFDHPAKFPESHYLKCLFASV